MAEIDDSREKQLARERSRRWRTTHSEKAAANTQAWYLANRTEILERKRKRRAANPDKARQDAAKAKAAQKATNPARYAYQCHKDSAKRRRIPFMLTFVEWWAIWQTSGKWAQRGLGSDQYCMARYGDAGAYEAGNVRICTGRENRTEARKGKSLSKAHRAALVEAWKDRRKRHLRPAGLASKRNLPRANV